MHPNDGLARRAGWWLAVLLGAGVLRAGGQEPAPRADAINPYPRQTITRGVVAQWDFAAGPAGWTAGNDCTVTAQAGSLRILSSGADPFVWGPAMRLAGPLQASLRIRCATASGAQIFWHTAEAPGWREPQSTRFDLVNDGAWHAYTVALRASGTVTALRLDPGGEPGLVEVADVRLIQANLHALEVERVEVADRTVVAYVHNHATNAVPATVNGNGVVFEAGRTSPVQLISTSKAAFEAFTVDIVPQGYPPLRRTLHLFHPGGEGQWVDREGDGLRLRVACDGKGALIERAGQAVAVIAPLVHGVDGTPVLLQAEASGTGPVTLRGDGVEVTLTLAGDVIRVAIVGAQDYEGPVVRAPGELRQGVFAGLEYLSRGEASSSTLDIETPEHVRFAPDPLMVTLPLMACVTELATVAVTWQEMSLRPVYAVPNFFEGTPDNRMALRGKKIEAEILVRAAGPIEEATLWAVRQRGLPPLPVRPRDQAAQDQLCLAALRGCLRNEQGWGHCAEASWPRQPFADVASTLWRLTGEQPAWPNLVPGGSHIRNEAIYLATGHAAEWLARCREQAADLIRTQKEDGSWRYAGPYRRGHNEDTASGLCARHAAALLDGAWLTGDAAAQAAGLKGLEFITRHFDTPRGAQTWELSLHTPDILASAHLVAAFTRGYELTRNPAYLAGARRWALSGMPFVYLWGSYPVMPYATIAVYGATNWRAPNWMGLPVQWCGYVYAHALAGLAKHDQTLDWNRVARGILLTAEQMQCPDGPYAGCLPDSFVLATQRRNGPMINPCAMLSLRLVLDGELDALAVARDGQHCVVAPFPVTLRDGRAHVRAKPGVRYQVIVDGARVVDVVSQGEDVVELPARP